MNKLYVNWSKTKFILFANRKQDEDVSFWVNGNFTEKASEIHFFNIILDDKLTWKSHVAFIQIKVRGNAYSTIVQPLFVLQKNAIIIMQKVNFREHTILFIKSIDWIEDIIAYVWRKEQACKLIEIVCFCFMENHTWKS